MTCNRFVTSGAAIWTSGSSVRIAAASPSVKLRLAASIRTPRALAALGVTANRLAPSVRSVSATSSSAPAPIDMVQITAATPTTTPSVVRDFGPC